MYSIVQFRSMIEGRLNINSRSNFDEIYSIIKVVEIRINRIISQTHSQIENSFMGKQTSTIVMNVLISLGLTTIVIALLIPLKKKLGRRMLGVRKMIGLLPFSMLAKSTRIKQYFNNTKNDNLY